MRRREFLTGIGVAGTAGLSGSALAMERIEREYFELRRYRLHGGAKKNMLGDFLGSGPCSGESCLGPPMILGSVSFIIIFI